MKVTLTEVYSVEISQEPGDSPHMAPLVRVAADYLKDNPGLNLEQLTPMNAERGGYMLHMRVRRERKVEPS